MHAHTYTHPDLRLDADSRLNPSSSHQPVLKIHIQAHTSRNAKVTKPIKNTNLLLGTSYVASPDTKTTHAETQKYTLTDSSSLTVQIHKLFHISPSCQAEPLHCRRCTFSQKPTHTTPTHALENSLFVTHTNTHTLSYKGAFSHSQKMSS